MQNQDYANASLLSLLMMWAAHRFQTMKPKYTAAQVAAETALSGNPPGA